MNFKAVCPANKHSSVSSYVFNNPIFHLSIAFPYSIWFFAFANVLQFISISNQQLQKFLFAKLYAFQLHNLWETILSNLAGCCHNSIYYFSVHYREIRFITVAVCGNVLQQNNNEECSLAWNALRALALYGRANERQWTKIAAKTASEKYQKCEVQKLCT